MELQLAPLQLKQHHLVRKKNKPKVEIKALQMHLKEANRRVARRLPHQQDQ